MARKSRYAQENAAAKRWSAALYARLSREDGDKDESDSIINQRLLLDEFASAQEDIKLFDTYTDDGYTGTNFERPDFERMLQDIRDKRVNCVIVKDLSRFGRNYVEVGRYLEQLFPFLDVRFISVNDHLDSYLRPDEMNNISIPIKNLMNDEYCKDISRKVKSSLDMKRRRGEFIGNYAPYGYQKDPSDRHKLIVDEAVSGVVQDIFGWFLGGMSLMGIAKRLNQAGVQTPSAYKIDQGYAHFAQHTNGAMCSKLWGITTIRRMLTDETYLGNLVQGQYKNKSYKVKKLTTVERSRWITVEGTHTPLVCRADFDAVQDLLRRNTRTSPTQKAVYPLSGFVRCMDCGMGMNRKISGKRAYYVCSTHKLSPESCSTHSIRDCVLENIVLKTIQVQISVIMDMEAALQRLAASEKAARKQDHFAALLRSKQHELDRVTESKLALYEDWKQGDLTREEYAQLKQRYQAKIDVLEAAIGQIETEQKTAVNAMAAENKLISAFKQFCNITELTRDVVVALVDNIYVREDKSIKIEFKFEDEYQIAHRCRIAKIMACGE